MSRHRHAWTWIRDVPIAVWIGGAAVGVPVGLAVGGAVGDVLIDDLARAAGSFGSDLGFVAGLAAAVWVLTKLPLKWGFLGFAVVGYFEEDRNPDGSKDRGGVSGALAGAAGFGIILLAFALLSGAFGAFIGRVIGESIGGLIGLLFATLAGAVALLIAGGIGAYASAGLILWISPHFRARSSGRESFLPTAPVSRQLAGETPPSQRVLLHFNVQVPHGSGAIFLAGSTTEVGSWRPNGRSLSTRDGGLYQGDVAVARGDLRFKFTRGSWDSVEVDEHGADIEDRIIAVDHEKTIDVVVANWRDGQPSLLNN